MTPTDTSRTRRAALYGIALLALVVLLSGAYLWSTRPPVFHGTSYDPPMPVPSFRLLDHTGEERTMEEYGGRPVLLFFGYTHCPDVCPLTLDRLSRVIGEIGGDAEDLQVLLVTVDPERDTPETLARYVSRFGPRVTGLTGGAAELERLRTEFHAYAAPAPPPSATTHEGHTGYAGHGGHGDHPQPEAHRMIGHTPVVFGIDRQGGRRVLLHGDAAEEELEEDIRTLLRL